MRSDYKLFNDLQARESGNNPQELFIVGKQGDSCNYFWRVLKSDQGQISDLNVFDENWRKTKEVIPCTCVSYRWKLVNVSHTRLTQVKEGVAFAIVGSKFLIEIHWGKF